MRYKFISLFLELLVFGGSHLSQAKPASLTLVSANVGNVDIVKCAGSFIYKLCRQDVEKKVSESLRNIHADIYILQEVLRPDQCSPINQKIPGTVCHEQFLKNSAYPKQIQRLIPEGYQYRCLDKQYECFAIPNKRGWVFEGDPHLIDYGENCEQGFSISWITVSVKGKKLNLVNGHPDSSSVACRNKSLQNLFQALQNSKYPTLMGGDWNMDPLGAAGLKSGKTPAFDESELTWQANVGKGKTFHYLSEDGQAPLVVTHPAGVLDHVVATKEIQGTCQTLDGKSAPALDGTLRQLDHFALRCELSPSF